MYQISFDLLGRFGVEQFEKVRKHLKKRQIEMYIAHRLPLNYNNLTQAVLSQLCFYANTLPLEHHENPIQDFSA